MSLDDIKTLRLLVAVDGSAGSIKAIHKAAEMAKDSVSYEIVLVHVIPAREFLGLVPEPENSNETTKGQAILDEMIQVCHSQDVECRTELLHGHPVQEILDYAQKYAPNMILIGNRGMNAARNALVGSVSSAIGKHAKHPVMIVR